MPSALGSRVPGQIGSVQGSVVDVVFASNALPRVHEALEIRDGDQVLCTLEVQGQRSSTEVRALALGKTAGLFRGQPVHALGRSLFAPVGDRVLGRVFDCFGNALDGGASLKDAPSAPLHHAPPPLHQQRARLEMIETGLKVVDLLCPFARGGKSGLFGGAGVGKTILLMEFVSAFTEAYSGLAVFAGVGERIREGHQLWQEFSKTGLMNRTAMVFGQMDAPPGVRMRVPHAALTVAEHFRDHDAKDVLLLIDNIFRFAQAGMESSALLGRLPSRVGYQPTLSTELATIEERITSTPHGSITSVQAVYVPADDLNDPAVVAVIEHFDAKVVLSRSMAAAGLYPAIDPLKSQSRLLDVRVVGQRHFSIAEEVRSVLSRYQELQDVISMLGFDELSPTDQVLVARARLLQRFLTQPFKVSEAFTGHPGVRVPLEETLRGCERILRGEFDDADERSLYMIGALPFTHRERSKSP